MITRIVELNNKSRKGEYLYISEKGKGRYYRMAEGQKIDPIVKYYQDRYIKHKPKATLKGYTTAFSDKVIGVKPKQRGAVVRQAEQYIRDIKKRPEVISAIKTGRRSAVIPNIETANRNTLMRAKKEMLSSLVYDKQLLELISSEENMKKLKNRLEYRITLKDEEGNVLMKANAFNKVPNQMMEELKGSVRAGEKIERNDYNISKKLEMIGFNNFERVHEGTISKIEMTMIFRKGK